MTRKGNVITGFAALAVVAIVMIAIFNWQKLLCSITTCPSAPTPTIIPSSVYVYGGYRYFEDKEIMSILLDQYHIAVKGEFRKGTFAMSDDYDPAKKQVDCIFPGSQIGIDYFKQNHPGVILNSMVAAQDRIVVFTWQELLPALEKAGLIYSKDGVWYLRMKPLVDAMIAENQWRDINAAIPGYVRVESTDPLKSSSGLQWMAFMGSYMVPGNETGGRLLTTDDLQTDPTILQRLYKYWENQGAQVDTTGKLFPKFITSGAGIPMIVAYESSFTDWYSPLPDAQKALATKIVGIYPETTINIEHILASLTPACNSLLGPVTNDVKIQQLAWENHGLHPQGLILERPSSAPWLALTIPYVPEPKKDVTDAIQQTLK
jgi:hypothetical protein